MHPPRRSLCFASVVASVLLLAAGTPHVQAAPPPPQAVEAADHPWDGGHAVDVTIFAPTSNSEVAAYLIQRAIAPDGLFVDAATVEREEGQLMPRTITTTVGDLVTGQEYWWRAASVDAQEERSEYVAAQEPAVPTQQPFDGSRFYFAMVLVFVCGSIIGCLLAARWGVPIFVRKIAALDAVDEAVGRATEMGRSCLFVPGIQDINDIQTIAGLTILSRIGNHAAQYECPVEVPTSKSLVMTAAQETLENAYLTAGRPDAYNSDLVYYVTDEQFGYVAYLSGMMVREKPAACFYLGAFFAESLILAETGNTIGAVQVAGTAQPSQLPFFVAACDYTLIGEEFFAASAYLSRDPDQLGSLKGQDIGKLLVTVLIIFGCGILTLASLSPLLFEPETAMASVIESLTESAIYLREVVLYGG